MNLSELNAAIIKWADDREITKHSTAYAQAFKTAEEVEELVRAHTTWRIVSDYTATEPTDAALAEIKDAIGDIYVTLVVGMACEHFIISRINAITSFERSAEAKPFEYLTHLLVKIGASSSVSPVGYDYQVHVSFAVQVLQQIARDFDTTLEECVNGAYNEIKDRKGKLLPNGIFVKES